MPFIPFFSNTTDIIPDFENTWKYYGGQSTYNKTESKKEYYKAVRENRNRKNQNLKSPSFEMRTYRTYGQQNQPYHSHSGSGGGGLPDEIDIAPQFNYTRRKRKPITVDRSYLDENYKIHGNYKRKIGDENLDDRIEQIRNGSGNFKGNVTRDKILKIRKKHAQDEARRRGIKTSSSDDTSGGSYLSIPILMAFIGIAVMLLIGILIFSEVSSAIENDPRYMNTTSTGAVGQNPLETVLKPFDNLSENLGGEQGMFVIYLMPMILIILIVVRIIGGVTTRNDE